MSLRRKRRPPVERISIRSKTSAEEILLLRGLMSGLNETVQSLWDTVDGLRSELAVVRPGAGRADPSDRRPLTWRAPPDGVDAAQQLETLQRQVDALHGDAECLWFEAQWLRAQLAVARGEGNP